MLLSSLLFYVHFPFGWFTPIAAPERWNWEQIWKTVTVFVWHYNTVDIFLFISIRRGMLQSAPHRRRTCLFVCGFVCSFMHFAKEFFSIFAQQSFVGKMAASKSKNHFRLECAGFWPTKGMCSIYHLQSEKRATPCLHQFICWCLYSQMKNLIYNENHLWRRPIFGNEPNF